MRPALAVVGMIVAAATLLLILSRPAACDPRRWVLKENRIFDTCTGRVFAMHRESSGEVSLTLVSELPTRARSGALDGLGNFLWGQP